MARKLSHHIEDNHMVPEMHYGSRPGRDCQSAVLHKVLLHDIVRLTRQATACTENDAIGWDNCGIKLSIILSQSMVHPALLTLVHQLFHCMDQGRVQHVDLYSGCYASV